MKSLIVAFGILFSVASPHAEDKYMLAGIDSLALHVAVDKNVGVVGVMDADLHTDLLWKLEDNNIHVVSIETARDHFYPILIVRISGVRYQGILFFKSAVQLPQLGMVSNDLLRVVAFESTEERALAVIYGRKLVMTFMTNYMGIVSEEGARSEVFKQTNIVLDQFIEAHKRVNQ
jgi:hypothetical protein